MFPHWGGLVQSFQQFIYDKGIKIHCVCVFSGIDRSVIESSCVNAAPVPPARCMATGRRRSRYKRQLWYVHTSVFSISLIVGSRCPVLKTNFAEPVSRRLTTL